VLASSNPILYIYSKMNQKELILRGRRLSSADVAYIRQTVDTHWEKGRSWISRFICQQWDWRQPNGQLKDMACRAILLRLEELELLKLPPRKCAGRNNRHPSFAPPSGFSTNPLVGTVGEFAPLKLEMVRWSKGERLWNWLVQTYHYQGYRLIVGPHLKYLAYLGGQVVACLGWGAPAWKVGSRDRFIGWNQEQRRSHLHFLLNNVRFLILPWIRVKYLASQVLASNIKVLPSDWQRFYQHPVVLLETFVDTSRFRGTCYQASNWLWVGQTKGSGKRGNHYYYHGQPKTVYLYPLRKDFREVLTGD